MLKLTVVAVEVQGLQSYTQTQSHAQRNVAYNVSINFRLC